MPTQSTISKVIVIAEMGLFTDVYDLFCVTAVAKFIGCLYYFDPSSHDPGKLPPHVNNATVGVALCANVVRQLFFGWLGDKLSRKKAYDITLAINMVACAVVSGLSFGSMATSVVITLLQVLARVWHWRSVR